MDSSPAQRRMSRCLQTSATGGQQAVGTVCGVWSVEQLRHRRQASKASYDISAKDLPVLTVGQGVRMKPLPGDRTDFWIQGSCMQRVAPRSNLVEVQGSLYRRNRVDLRATERTTPQNLTAAFPDQAQYMIELGLAKARLGCWRFSAQYCPLCALIPQWAAGFRSPQHHTKRRQRDLGSP